MSQLEALLERTRMATGPNRELDAAIHKSLVGLRMYESFYTRPTGDLCLRYYADPTGPSYYSLPRYTASIDAALALVEKLLPGWCVNILQRPNYWEAVLHSHFANRVDQGPHEQWPSGELPAASLAILGALLFALIEQQKHERAE